jgi:hypothetical protein
VAAAAAAAAVGFVASALTGHPSQALHSKLIRRQQQQRAACPSEFLLSRGTPYQLLATAVVYTAVLCCCLCNGMLAIPPSPCSVLFSEGPALHTSDQVLTVVLLLLLLLLLLPSFCCCSGGRRSA